jgi:hypothetical protein
MLPCCCKMLPPSEAEEQGCATHDSPCSGPYNVTCCCCSSSPVQEAGPTTYSSMAVSSPPLPRPSTSRAISSDTSSRHRSISSTARASFIRPATAATRGGTAPSAPCTPATAPRATPAWFSPHPWIRRRRQRHQEDHAVGCEHAERPRELRQHVEQPPISNGVVSEM